ncbi:MAG TPA: tetratricopeptide repeat protein [Steroidobacteraceae bacterium]|nr:tetratricopeptide repeat protein [Steroidobacteraceae bacterium]
MPSRNDMLKQARAALSRGDAGDAGRRSAELLSADPRDVEARHLRGRCHAALGHWSDAAAEFRRVLSDRPGFLPAMRDLGMVQAMAGEYREAQALLERARALDPRPAEPYFGLGLCRMGLDDMRGAAQEFRDAIARNPRLLDAHNHLGVVHDRLGELPRAIECFRQAVALRSDFLPALSNLADALLRGGDAAAAAAVLRDAAALAPGDAPLHADLGAARLAAGDFAGAAAALERAVTLDARLVEAQANLGEALRNLEKLAAARAAFERALMIDPDLAEAHLGLGKISAATRQAPQALAALWRAVQLKPGDPHITLTASSLLEQLGYQDQALSMLDDFAAACAGNPDVLDARAAHLHRRGRLEAAVAGYQGALALQTDRADSLLGLGRALESLGRHAEAIGCLERGLAQRPGHCESVAALASCAIRVCDWNRLDRALSQLREMPLGIDSLHPFVRLGLELSHAERVRSLPRRAPRGDEAAAVPVRFDHERLRIAYVSPDFRDHPVAHALVGVIERHDRGRFEPLAISLAGSGPGAADGAGIGRRLRSSFDRFIDASAMDTPSIVALMRELEVDIAIDLAGHTVGARPAIFAQRAAPVQVNYLGFPASSGFSFMDYLIADECVVPLCDEPLYTERVVRMPGCYLPFDCSRPRPATDCGRQGAGLPAEGFVFCAFNNGYKITRPVFDLWMSLLREVPGSVLWLRSMGALATTNLRSAAASAGIGPERLIVAQYLADPDAHLARLRLADVFLDTLPYNAHTSAAEALWAGVPVVTCRGGTFAGRVGASLLTAAGLAEFIREDLDGYRRLALDLAQSPPALRALRERVDRLRLSAPLFDTGRYTRDLEELLLRIRRT